MKIIELNAETKKNILENLLKRSPNQYDQYTGVVDGILKEVKDKGDQALFEMTKQFDKAEINQDNIKVTAEEIEEAYTAVDTSVVNVIRKAKENIEAYHVKQKRY
ncbi:MAG TPA: histidinol dehydrogenase, partial [Mobilitalea sp.]|nr:histidinol dehydrogenase [Mobilitalea sp.]